MSEHDRPKDHDKHEPPEEDAFEDAIVAADDTGMVSNEINIVEVETEEGLENP